MCPDPPYILHAYQLDATHGGTLSHVETTFKSRISQAMIGKKKQSSRITSSAYWRGIEAVRLLDTA